VPVAEPVLRALGDHLHDERPAVPHRSDLRGAQRRAGQPLSAEGVDETRGRGLGPGCRRPVTGCGIPA
jgi:hypothetical protein